MPTYTAYGLSINSSVEIPELATSNNGDEPDVQIQLAPIASVPPEAGDSAGRAYRSSADEIIYVKSKCGRFRIKNGVEITVDPDPGIEERVWRLSLFGPALALLLIQRGYLVLHGGAVVFSGGTVLLLGPGGIGKSTLTAELCRQGGGLLTDDVVVIDMKSSPPQVLPGIPLIKLWPDAVEQAPEGVWTKILHPDFDKVGRRMVDSDLAKPSPVARTIFLGGAEKISCEVLSGTRAFRALMSAMFAARYGNDFVSGLDGEGLLKDVSQLMEIAPVEALFRPKDSSLLSETAAMIKAKVISDKD